jgi:hypothetical protein
LHWFQSHEPDQRSTGFWTSPKFGTDGLTDYLAVTGIDTFQPNPSGRPDWRDRNSGVLYGSSHIRISQICDGASNTVLVGERPPSPDLFWGWWTWSALDASLGVRDTFTVYGLGVRGDFNSQSCYGLLPEKYRPGIGNNCDVHHFWSQHSGGSNWLFATARSAFWVMPMLASCHRWPRGREVK